MGVFKRYSKSKDGQKTAFWYIRYSVNGKLKWKSVGKVGEVTKTVAERELEKEKKKLRRGLYEYEDITLEGIEDEYIAYIRGVRQIRSWKSRAIHIRFLKDFFKDKKLSQITPKDIDDLKALLLREQKPATINRTLATLRNIFNTAKNWKMFYGENPVTVSGLLTEDNQRERILSPKEEIRLLECSAQHLKPIIITALQTGMRKNEILSLKWSNVDFYKKELIIEATNNKSKRVKKIPLNYSLLPMLREMRIKYHKHSEYVFLGENYKPLKDIKRAFNGACRRAGIEGLRFHDLRHTAGTRMIESGVGILEVTKILGNSSLEMTMKRYIHPEDSLRTAVDKLAQYNQRYSKNYSNENEGAL